MPYIDKERREELGPGGFDPETSGELNYRLTRELISYMRNKKLSYTLINDCLGAIEGAKLEFYRRVVGPYENAAIRRNGDVYNIEETLE